MRLITALLTTLMFSLPAMALELAGRMPASQMRSLQAPMLLCENELVSARIYAAPQQDEVEMIIESSVAFMSHQVAQSFYTLEGAQVFQGDVSALILTETEEGLQGVLEADMNQPSTQQVLDCKAYYSTQPIAQPASI